MHPDDAVLNDLVDEALDARQAHEVEQHLAACAQCRALVDDLREIRRVAGSLDLRQPPARAWSRIERAIRLEDGGARFEDRAAESATRGAGRPAFGTRTLTWLAAAAVLVLATVVGVRYGVNRTTAPRPSTEQTADSGNAAAADTSVAAVEAELRAAESHYDKAIKGLEQIASSESNALDPKTAATLQKNLAVIDQAISESRAAVRAQPTSEPARESLMDSFKTKLALLQDTVALINEMRKGNEAGAARVVSGLKQKGN
jgi:anti-sigma factor RsiW